MHSIDGAEASLGFGCGVFPLYDIYGVYIYVCYTRMQVLPIHTQVDACEWKSMDYLKGHFSGWR